MNSQFAVSALLVDSISKTELCLRKVFFVVFFTLCGDATRVFAQSVADTDQARTARHLAMREYAKQNNGNVERGKVLFASDSKLNCSKCHALDFATRSVGPNLSAIGNKLERSSLVTSILEPSQSIAVGYGTTNILTADGRVVAGVLQRVTKDWIELLDKESKSIRIASNDIDQQRESSVSMMPEGLELGLSNSDFADLIAYLSSLKSLATGNSPDGVTNHIPLASSPVGLIPAFGQLVFDKPVWIGEIPESRTGKTLNSQYVVLEQAGRAFAVQHSGDSWIKTEVFSNVDLVRMGGATGLLGMAFHPSFETNHRFYIKYQTVEKGRIQTVVEERRYLGSTDVGDRSGTKELLRIDATTQDHNGGCLEFGPDGFLYIGMGDSGPQGDPQGHGQDLKTLLGKILRIDVDKITGMLPYGIPADNPFVSVPSAKPEIWAYGFREPWRFSFDTLNGELWAGDVGQNRFEEVSIVKAGENHGWNVFEGHVPHSNEFRQVEANYVAPVFSYSRSLGVSITGGYVYRGKSAPSMDGWYICGDFESRRIWALKRNADSRDQLVEIGRAPSRIVSFGRDLRGELYLVGYDNGTVYNMDFQKLDTAPSLVRTIANTSQHSGVIWRYTTANDTDNWMAYDFDDTRWSIGPGGFGTTGTPGSFVRTDWNNGNIWIRRSFELTEPVDPSSNLKLLMHHDEDVEVYINGVEAIRRNGWTNAYDEFEMKSEAIQSLRPGRNVIAIHCRQTRGGQYIDAGIMLYGSKE